MIIIAFVSACLLPQAQQTVGLLQHDTLAAEGYTLIVPMRNTDAYLIDNCGRLINTWPSSYLTRTYSYLLDDGSLLHAGKSSKNILNAGGAGGIVEIIDWNGNQTWQFELSDSNYRQHHDLEPLDNGNFLMFAWEKKTLSEAAALGRDTSSMTNDFWSEAIYEVEMVGTDSANLIWEWHAWDHMVQQFDSTKPNFDSIADRPELIDINSRILAGGTSDWLHFNSIDYNAALDQIMVSVHGLNEIWIIDHSTTTNEASGHTGGNSGKGGDLLYRWGNPIIYGRGDSSDQMFFKQHDARWIEDSLLFGGKIMVYNNGLGRPGGNHSSVDVINPPVDSAGNYTIQSGMPFGPNQLHFSYDGDTNSWFSLNISGADVLPNDHLLICDGPAGRIFEIDSSGNLFWEYVSPVRDTGIMSQGDLPVSNDVFRAKRYQADFAGFVGKNLSPGDPIEFNPSPLPAACNSINIEPAHAPRFSVYPNPFRDKIVFENSESPVEIEIVDMYGRIKETQFVTAGKSEIKTNGWSTGLYIVRTSTGWSWKLLKERGD